MKVSKLTLANALKLRRHFYHCTRADLGIMRFPKLACCQGPRLGLGWGMGLVVCN